MPPAAEPRRQLLLNPQQARLMQANQLAQTRVVLQLVHVRDAFVIQPVERQQGQRRLPAGPALRRLWQGPRKVAQDLRLAQFSSTRTPPSGLTRLILSSPVTTTGEVNSDI